MFLCVLIHQFAKPVNFVNFAKCASNYFARGPLYGSSPYQGSVKGSLQIGQPRAAWLAADAPRATKLSLTAGRFASARPILVGMGTASRPLSLSLCTRPPVE